MTATAAAAAAPARRAAWGSFQQLLLLAFLLVAGAMGAIAWRAVVTFDHLVAQSRGFSARTLQLNAIVQELGHRSAAMERAARQSLILNDRPLRAAFDDAAREAARLLDELGHGDVPPALAARWRGQLEAITALFNGPADTALERERTMAAQFRALEGSNAAIAQAVQQAIEQRGQTLSAQLDAGRRRQIRRVVAACAIAIALAGALGIWLGRPFRRLERAIVGLGENRLAEPIAIRGPADLRRAGQQLDWLRLRLAELDADKARFLRHISHELKTPLAALREGVALLQDGVAGELTPSQREVAAILQQNTVVLQGQIEALLRFNAAAFEARQLRRAPTDLLQLLEEQVDAQRLQWQGQGLRVRVQGAHLVAQVDAAKLATVIGNLLSNAIRFSPPGGTVTMALARAGDGARIDVADQGPGVAEADRARIFEPFYRGERQPAAAARGTGVGLSIVQEYIAAHGGTIVLLPTSAGAHFRIELPHALS